ncbi:MAG: ThiF family adenylyltransferase, partial [Acidimicrobiia bacterium]
QWRPGKVGQKHADAGRTRNLVPSDREPTDTLLAGRRALEGMAGVVLLEDWVWDERSGHWVLHCLLSADVAPDGPVPATTEWYLLVSPAYPWGLIEFYPGKTGGIAQTFPHQMYNAEGPAGQLWRTGDLCVRTGMRAVERHAYDSEPYDAHGRLRWNFERALSWLSAASRGELVQAGDPCELPSLPASASQAAVVFSEGSDTFGLWQELPERFGLVDLVPLRSKRERLLVKAFRSSAGRALLVPAWGTGLEVNMPEGVHVGIWFRLEEPPILPPYQIPMTWREVRAACQAQGIELDDVLRPVVGSLRDGKSHVALVGFPVPARAGEPPQQMHWQALRLPVLSHGAQSMSGFGPSEVGYWQRDRSQLLDEEPIEWLMSENWHREQITTRGRLPEMLRSKAVLLLGAGALGSALGELLVRGGTHMLTIVDHDTLEAGNLVRHTLGLAEIDEAKAEALADRLNRVSPHASVRYVNGRFPRFEGDEPGVWECDVVIDCTGSDEVLHDLRAFEWDCPKLFFSVSLGLDARRLFCFTAAGRTFPHPTFVRMTQPWLAKEIEEHGGRELPREGVGCWSPVFPARIDDIWMMAAVAVKDLEQSVASPPKEPVLRVYVQDYKSGLFTRVRLLPEDGHAGR